MGLGGVGVQFKARGQVGERTNQLSVEDVQQHTHWVGDISDELTELREAREPAYEPRFGASLASRYLWKAPM